MKSTSPELAAFEAEVSSALADAAQEAKRIARESNTPIVVVRNGQIVELWPDDDFAQPRRVIEAGAPRSREDQ